MRRPAPVLAALVALTVPLAACGDDGPGTLAIDQTPSTYRITYRVEDGDVVSSERLTVERPFASLIETFASDDGSGDALTVEVTSFGRSSRRSGSAGRLAVAIPPGVAPGDARVDRALGTDVLERRGRKTVAGRDCQVYRTGQSLRLVELIPERDGARVDVCIDAAGLVLEEVGGDRSRRAIDVDVDPALDRDVFDVGERTIPVLDGGGATQELTKDSRPPGEFWELGDEVPLPHVGRYAVVPPQPDAFGDATLRGQRVATTTDVLTDDLEVVVVDRGGSLGGVDVVDEDTAGEAVELGALGKGRLLRTSFGAEITVELGGGRFVRISGTLADEELVAVARGMREVDGGELSPVGDAW